MARSPLIGRRGSQKTGNLVTGCHGASTSRTGICFTLFTSRFGAKRAGPLVPGYMLYPDTPGAAGPFSGPSKQRFGAMEAQGPWESSEGPAGASRGRTPLMRGRPSEVRPVTAAVAEESPVTRAQSGSLMVWARVFCPSKGAVGAGVPMPCRISRVASDLSPTQLVIGTGSARCENWDENAKHSQLDRGRGAAWPKGPDI